MTDRLVHCQLFRQRYRFAREESVLRIDTWSDPQPPASWSSTSPRRWRSGTRSPRES